MPVLETGRLYVLQNRLVAGDIRARDRLFDRDRLHGLRLEEGTSTHESLHSDFTVRWV